MQNMTDNDQSLSPLSCAAGSYESSQVVNRFSAARELPDDAMNQHIHEREDYPTGPFVLGGLITLVMKADFRRLMRLAAVYSDSDQAFAAGYSILTSAS